MVSVVQETPNAPCSWEETGGVEKLPSLPMLQRSGPGCLAGFGTYHTFGVLSLYSQLCMSSPTWANLLMGSDYAGSKDPESLSLRLKGVLEEIHQEQWPHLPNPPGCKKRASVSLVIRIRPAFTQEAVFDKDRNSSSLQPFQTCLDSFFSQRWVQHGDPEVLLIKRAARAGDRWTSHIALPGGKMEPDDADDRATSIRETMEETGLELNTDHCLYIGNLPERVIKVMWGETP